MRPPTKAELLAEGCKFFRSRMSAQSLSPVPVFSQRARLGGQLIAAEVLAVELMPSLVLRVRGTDGLFAQSFAGRISEVDADAVATVPLVRQTAILALANALYRLRTRQDSIYAARLFHRLLKPHDSGFDRTYSVELSPSLVLRVRDRRTAEVFAQSLSGQIDRLAPHVRLVAMNGSAA